MSDIDTMTDTSGDDPSTNESAEAGEFDVTQAEAVTADDGVAFAADAPPADADTSAAESSATEAAEQPVAEAPGAEEAPADEPVAEAPVEEPVADPSAAESSATEVAEESVAEAPVVEAAPTEAPVPEEPSGEAEAPDTPGDIVTDDELLEQHAPVESPYDRPGRWFVVHTQSGYEKKVKQNLEARIVSMNAEDSIYEVVIPMEDYVDFRNGKRVVAQRKMFPGYLLVRSELDDQAWFVIRNTPGVTGFVGQGAKPSPLPRRDVEAFLVAEGGTEEQVAQRAKPRLEYEIGETVRVREGPFADFSGEVIELNEDQLKLKVLVNIFGRETPVELEFSKVAKL
jgi:transcriptional antiterminator NusG